MIRLPTQTDVGRSLAGTVLTCEEPISLGSLLQPVSMLLARQFSDRPQPYGFFASGRRENVLLCGGVEGTRHCSSPAKSVEPNKSTSERHKAGFAPRPHSKAFSLTNDKGRFG